MDTGLCGRLKDRSLQLAPSPPCGEGSTYPTHCEVQCPRDTELQGQIPKTAHTLVAWRAAGWAWGNAAGPGEALSPHRQGSPRWGLWDCQPELTMHLLACRDAGEALLTFGVLASVSPDKPVPT